MTFSYTDDAIVSASPTGRHLSTVIKRPVVLMSGWDEHAAEICKVLNELKPAESVGPSMSMSELIGRGYLQMVGRVQRKQPRVVLDYAQNLPKCPDFTPLETRVCQAEQIKALTAELEEVQAQLAEPVEVSAGACSALLSCVPGVTLAQRSGRRKLRRV